MARSELLASRVLAGANSPDNVDVFFLAAPHHPIRPHYGPVFEFVVLAD